MKFSTFLDNIRIGSKLIGGFILVTLLMASIGMIGFTGMSTIADSMNRMYTDDTIPLMEVSGMEVSLNSMRALVFRSMAIVDERKQDEGRMKIEVDAIDSHINNLSSRTMTPEEQEVFSTFSHQWPEYKSAALQVFELEKSGKEEEALTSIRNGGTHANARRATVATFDTFKKILLTRTEQTAQAGRDEVNRTLLVMTGIGLFVVVLSLVIAMVLTRSIIRPLHLVMDQFDRMSRGDVGSRLNLKRSDEIGEMAQMFDRFSDFLETEVVGALRRIARGDLSIHVVPKDESDQISPALIGMITALTKVIYELELMTERAGSGDLRVRGDDSQLQGSYREIVTGFNHTLEALIVPVNEAIRLASEYAGCNFSAQFSEEVEIKGDFVAFRDAMNGIGREVSGTLRIIEAQMIELAEHAQRADSGIGDVSRGAGIIAANADQTRVNSERSEDELGQVLKAMEDLTTNVTNVSTQVESVAREGAEADHLARKGTLAAASAEEGMEHIRSASSEASSVILDMRNRMDEISKITGIISDISEQTSLLALNAAIEAARAGDAGRGFAVVAGEVKALAGQAGDAAREITSMIEGLGKQSLLATSAMKGAEEAIEQGRSALSESLEIFGDLTRAVSGISSVMRTISGSTEQQAASFEEITASVNEMSGHVRQTAKDALNSSATAEEALAVVDQITGIITEINHVVSTTGKEMKKFSIRQSVS
ncbi:MAG TPA: methyl-accepting chemotaxis protein [Methanospirillum sp.]|nr:methyl-accepting chemotaxis protein [Methanospirillum sp.]